ncbi:MAG: NAD(P)/FAD-dependent oxidoreductase [Planctomycetota bacterium]|jgi:flavin-dependent dehydrogenase
MPQPLDAILVGGGPAGALTARTLAQQGWRVLVVEKGPRHREKACGHCLNPRAMAVLAEAGLLEDVRRLAVGCTDSLRVHRPGRDPFEVPLMQPGIQPGLVVDRRRLDQFLLDAAAEAGAIVRQPATARLEDPRPGGSRVRITDGTGVDRMTARLVVGADGLRSGVASAAGLARRRSPGRNYGFAFDVPTHAAARPGTIEMFLVPQGYVGVVTGGVGVAHVAALARRGAEGGAASPRNFIRDVAGKFDHLRDLVRAMEGGRSDQLTEVVRQRENAASPVRPGLRPGVASRDGNLTGLDPRAKPGANQRFVGLPHFVACGPMPCRPASIANGAAALVGDAAGYVEPFTGEGLAWALEGARLLGSVASTLEPGGWSAGAAARYERTWRRTIARRQRVCRGLARVLERPGLTDLLMLLGVGWPRMRHAIARQVVAT